MDCKTHGKGETWGTPWIPLISDLKKHDCPKCSKCYRYTETESLIRVKQFLTKNQPTLKIIGFIQYIGKDSKCNITCEKHGNGLTWGTPWTPVINVILRGFGCPKCSNTYQFSVDERIEQLNERLVDKPWTVLSIEKMGNKAICQVHCDIHGDGSKWGNPWMPIVNDLTSNLGCPKCSKNYAKTENEAKYEVNQVLNRNGYHHSVTSFFGQYKGKETYCNVSCGKHGDTDLWGNPWHPKLHDLKTKTINCLKCSGQYLPTEQEAVEEINNGLENTHIRIIGFENYLLNEELNNSRCIMNCAIHGMGKDFPTQWRPALSDLKRGSSCPLCAIEKRSLRLILQSPKLFHEPCYLYYVCFIQSDTSKKFYKVGIRQNSKLSSRYSKTKLEEANLTIISEWKAQYPRVICLIVEYWLLRKFASERKYQSILRTSRLGGATECFKSDITKKTNIKILVQGALKCIPSILDDFSEHIDNKVDLLKSIKSSME